MADIVALYAWCWDDSLLETMDMARNVQQKAKEGEGIILLPQGVLDGSLMNVFEVFISRWIFQQTAQTFQKYSRRLGKHLVFLPDNTGRSFKPGQERAKTEITALRIDEFIKTQRIPQPLVYQ